MMIRSNTFSFINDILVVFLMALFFLVVILSVMRAFEPSTIEIEPAHQFTPITAKKTYNDIGGPIFALKEDFLSKQLPDLRSAFTYYGESRRPDVDFSQKTYTIATKVNSSLMPVSAMKPIYLSNVNDQYIFSPNNEKTDLWIKLEPKDSGTEIYAYTEDLEGNLITQPSVLSQFTLMEQDLKKSGQSVWYLGKVVVDKNLLKTQKAVWFGKDVFLQKHGGEEYLAVKDKDRIDFGVSPNVYSAFVQTGDKLIWKDDRWQMAPVGESTIQYPLMVVTNVSDKSISVQVWDITGRRMVDLQLSQSRAPLLLTTDVTKSFKFIGYKTWTEFVIEVDGKRIVVSAGDWLLREQKKPWEQLSTPEQIEKFVSRNLQGTLFIVDEVLKKEGKLILKGHLFDPSRTKEREVELIQVAGGAKTPSSLKKTSQVQERVPQKPQKNMPRRRRFPMRRRLPQN